MFKKFFYTIIFFIIATSLYAKEDLNYYFLEGQKYYEKKDFDQAINLFEKIMASAKESGNVYYNLGNCYFRKKDYGMAMLNYERAKRLMPYDNDLKKNIELINQLYLKDKISSQEWIGTYAMDFLTNFLNAKIWIFIMSCLFIFLNISIIAFFARHKIYIKKIISYLVILFVIVSIFGMYRYYQDYILKYGIIVSKDKVQIKSGPGAEYDSLFELHEASKIKILENREGWIYIELLNGLKGWVMPEAVKKI